MLAFGWGFEWVVKIGWGRTAGGQCYHCLLMVLACLREQLIYLVVVKSRVSFPGRHHVER